MYGMGGGGSMPLGAYGHPGAGYIVTGGGPAGAAGYAPVPGQPFYPFYNPVPSYYGPQQGYYAQPQAYGGPPPQPSSSPRTRPDSPRGACCDVAACSGWVPAVVSDSRDCRVARMLQGPTAPICSSTTSPGT